MVFRPELVERVYVRKGIVIAPKGAISWREAFFVALNNMKNNKKYNNKIKELKRLQKRIKVNTAVLANDIEAYELGFKELLKEGGKL